VPSMLVEPWRMMKDCDGTGVLSPTDILLESLVIGGKTNYDTDIIYNQIFGINI
jgi:hypothetical protein